MVDTDPSDLTAQMSFLLAADQLKSVMRANRVADGSRHENSAEHSWYVTLMAMVLAPHCPHPIHLGRVLELLTTHDLVEVYAGDTPLYNQAAAVGQTDREAQAAEKLFGLLPAAQRDVFTSLWVEFETASTPEARFARAIDALAPTWLHWGPHSVNPPDNLTRKQILERKAQWLEPYPSLFSFLEQFLASAVERDLLRSA